MLCAKRFLFLDSITSLFVSHTVHLEMILGRPYHFRRKNIKVYIMRLLFSPTDASNADTHT